MAKRVVWVVRAQNDRIEILAYWRNRSKSNKYSKIPDGLFRNSVRLISKYPLIGKSTNRRNVRLKIVKNYFIVYEIRKDVIIILRIWDSRRNPKELKEANF